ncbi:MAG: ABC transporter substrate-binding protein, partial [Promethearchaeota archaeon]
ISRTYDNSFGHLTINCDKYPLSVTAFRRALAFAIDKEQIIADAGVDAFPLDLPLPKCSPWSIEDDLEYYYYESNVEEGNRLLDNAGFLDLDADGYREAPDGTAFDIEIEPYGYGAHHSLIGHSSQSILQALTRLSIRAEIIFPDWWGSYYRDYDMMVYVYGFSSTGLEMPFHLEYGYGSEYADIEDYNVVHFRNDTYDTWIPQMKYGSSEDEIREATSEMLKILHYECPRIALYSLYNYGVYRADRFQGHILDPISNIFNLWNSLNVHGVSSPFGGTYRIVHAYDIAQFNHMVGTGGWDHRPPYVSSHFDLTLLKRDTNNNYLPWLAESFTTATHADDPEVPSGHRRYTFNLIGSASWSDGTAVTAADVAFTFNYYKDGIAQGNFAGEGLEDLVVAYASGPYAVVLELASESYWDFAYIADAIIIPRHYFAPLGIDGFLSWDPVFGDDSLITAGPFTVGSAVETEYVELERDPNFFYRIEQPNPPVVESTESVTITEGTTGNFISWFVGNGYRYEFYIDEILVASSTISGGTISYNLDNLGPGTYEYSLVIHGLDGSIIIGTGVIYVLPEVIAGETEEDPDFIPLLVAVAVGLTIMATGGIGIFGRPKKKGFQMSKYDY